MNNCPIVEWSIIQKVFWLADKIVYYSDHGLNNSYYRASEYQTMLSAIQVPLKYWTIIGIWIAAK